MQYEVIFEGISRWFDDYEEAIDLAKVTSCEYGVSIFRDWADGYKFTYANGEQVDCVEIPCSDDDPNDWEEPWAEDDDDDCGLEDDYDEPYDPFDEVGYDPYSGGYDIDL